jgi:hypothetical protein
MSVFEHAVVDLNLLNKKIEIIRKIEVRFKFLLKLFLTPLGTRKVIVRPFEKTLLRFCVKSLFSLSVSSGLVNFPLNLIQ